MEPERLHFSATNWQQEQTVSIKVDQDDIAPSGVGIATCALQVFQYLQLV